MSGMPCCLKRSVFVMPQKIDQPPADSGPPDVRILSYRSAPAGSRHSVFGRLAIVMAGVTGLWLGCDLVISWNIAVPGWSALAPLRDVLDELYLLPCVMGVASGFVGFAKKDDANVLGKTAIYVILYAYLLFTVGRKFGGHS